MNRPHVLVIIPCFNEARHIAHKLRNTLALTYAEKTIVVVDDRSSDRTVEEASRFADHGVRVFSNTGPPGKNRAVALALERIPSELACVTDADALVPPHALEALVAPFRDPAVGAACGKQGYLTRQQWERGEWRSTRLDLIDRMSHALRLLENRLNSMVGLHGQFLVFRRTGQGWIDDGIRGDDVELTFRMCREGFRVLYVPTIEHFELVPPDRHSHDRQRARRAQAVQASFLRHWTMLLNPRYGWFGLVCFPLEFFCYVVQPVLVLGLGVAVVVHGVTRLLRGELADLVLLLGVGVLAVGSPLRRYLAVNLLLLKGLGPLVRRRTLGDRWA